MALQAGFEQSISASVIDLYGQVSAYDNQPISDEPFIMKDYATTINQTFPLDYGASIQVEDSSVFEIDHSGDEFLPDMNSTLPAVFTTKSGTSNVITNSHTSSQVGPIDHHYIKALPYWTKEGHWFPKTGYSQLRYQVYFRTYIGVVTFKAYVKIQSGADTIPRYLRFYLDGNRVGQKIIYAGINEHTFEFGIWWGGTHTLTVEIYWGGYRDYGWKLIMMEVYYPTFAADYDTYTWDYRRDLETEFFPKASYSRLEFDVLLGPNSWAYIKIDRQDDAYARYFWIYVDGLKKNGDLDWTPLSKPFYLGEYARRSLHKLRLEIYWGGYKDYGWKLDMKQFKVFYDSVFVEVDYMADGNHNHKPDENAILNVITDYYKLHGAQNVAFIIDQSVPHRDYINWNSFNSDYYNVYFQHKGQYGWKYMLSAHYEDNFWTLGKATVSGDRFYILAQRIADVLPPFWIWNPFVTYDKTIRVVIMHELGHSVGIYISDTNGEVYCPQSYSVMSEVNGHNNGENYQAYDWEHWSLRRMP